MTLFVGADALLGRPVHTCQHISDMNRAVSAEKRHYGAGTETYHQVPFTVRGLRHLGSFLTSWMPAWVAFSVSLCAA